MNNILEKLQEKSIELIPSTATEVRLFVQTDTNDADYVSETYTFEIDELEDAIAIAENLYQAPEDFNNNEDWLEFAENFKGPSGKEYDLVWDFIPRDADGEAHTITCIDLKVFIDGKEYLIN
jgi:hypothetical protein